MSLHLGESLRYLHLGESFCFLALLEAGEMGDRKPRMSVWEKGVFVAFCLPQMLSCPSEPPVAVLIRCSHLVLS